MRARLLRARRTKEWLLLDGLRVRGLAQVSIHVSLSLISMLAVAPSAVRLRSPNLVRCIKASLSESSPRRLAQGFPSFFCGCF
jgi:hypothetical protein